MKIYLTAHNNRDGDITFDSADQTSADKPYRFWVNDDNDGYSSGIDDYPFLSPVADRYSIFAYADPSWSYALGAQADVGGFSKQTDLRTIWPLDHFSNNYKDHAWHSGEFNFDNMQQANFWKTLLGSQGFDLK